MGSSGRSTLFPSPRATARMLVTCCRKAPHSSAILWRRESTIVRMGRLMSSTATRTTEASVRATCWGRASGSPRARKSKRVATTSSISFNLPCSSSRRSENAAQRASSWVQRSCCSCTCRWTEAAKLCSASRAPRAPAADLRAAALPSRPPPTPEMLPLFLKSSIDCRNSMIDDWNLVNSAVEKMSKHARCIAWLCLINSSACCCIWAAIPSSTLRDSLNCAAMCVMLASSSVLRNILAQFVASSTKARRHCSMSASARCCAASLSDDTGGEAGAPPKLLIDLLKVSPRAGPSDPRGGDGDDLREDDNSSVCSPRVESGDARSGGSESNGHDVEQ
mmetsp:Transcript_16761/g.47837  ORF Transcript_16761/g.47837 Transcript_16761/m.47837 type:complete len:335 (+) Transcript_16761:811-1815(+)